MLTARSKLLVLGGNKSFHAHRSRVNGFCEGLAGSGLEVLEVIEAFDRFGDTRDNIASALARYPEVDGIYMATGDVGGCLDAIKRSGKSGAIRIVCNDLLPDIEQGMREGAIDFTIVQNPFQQGYRSLRILYDLLFSGRKPDNEHCYTETSIVIPESL
jgi:LacI family transcriptional regulator